MKYNIYRHKDGRELRIKAKHLHRQVWYLLKGFRFMYSHEYND